MSGKQSAKPRLGGVFFFVRQNFRDFPVPVGSYKEPSSLCITSSSSVRSNANVAC